MGEKFMCYQARCSLYGMKYLPVTVCIPLFIAGMVLASTLEVGDVAPGFEVYEGKSVPLNSSSLKGKVLIITYETKDVLDKNKKFKDRMLDYLSEDDTHSTVAIVPVINCFKYTWPFDKYCITKVQENARTLGMRLYDDRKGTMYDDFNIRDNESNVFIVDKKGVVSYRKAGRLNDAERNDAMKLIQKLSLRKQHSTLQRPTLQ